MDFRADLLSRYYNTVYTLKADTQKISLFVQQNTFTERRNLRIHPISIVTNPFQILVLF